MRCEGASSTASCYGNGVYMYDRIAQIDLARSNPQSAEEQEYRKEVTDLALAAGRPGQF